MDDSDSNLCANNFHPSDLESNDTLSELAWEAQGISTSDAFRLENFNYSNDVIRNTIFNHVEQTGFTGITVSETLILKVAQTHTGTHTYWGTLSYTTSHMMLLP